MSYSAFQRVTFFINILTLLILLSLPAALRSESKTQPELYLSYRKDGGMYPLREKLDWSGNSGTYSYFHKEKKIEKRLDGDFRRKIQSLMNKLYGLNLPKPQIPVGDSPALEPDPILDRSSKQIQFSRDGEMHTIDGKDEANQTESGQKKIQKAFLLLENFCSTLR